MDDRVSLDARQAAIRKGAQPPVAGCADAWRCRACTGGSGGIGPRAMTRKPSARARQALEKVRCRSPRWPQTGRCSMVHTCGPRGGGGCSTTTVQAETMPAINSSSARGQEKNSSGHDIPPFGLEFPTPACSGHRLAPVPTNRPALDFVKTAPVAHPEMATTFRSTPGTPIAPATRQRRLWPCRANRWR